jgi:SAM-dependent methyltransferase
MRETLRPADLERLRTVLPGPVSLSDTGDVVLGGNLHVPVQGGVVRFRSDEGYNASFALQWNRFRHNQIDAVNGTSLTMRRFAEAEWPIEGLRGQLVLEAGCGAGRFTRLLGDSGAQLVTFDYSTAVDASIENNGQLGNVTFAQCDIFEMPFLDGIFDRVFCYGVLQHTPDPRAAFFSIERKLRPGGRISVDVYLKDGKIRPWKSKYLWRPITVRMDQQRLLRFLEWFIPLWLPFDTAIKRIPLLGPYLGSVIPCWNYFYTDLSPREKQQWAIMDTFDALAPRYDNPVTVNEVTEWFTSLGYREFVVREGGNGVVGNGTKPDPCAG